MSDEPIDSYGANGITREMVEAANRMTPGAVDNLARMTPAAEIARIKAKYDLGDWIRPIGAAAAPE